MSEAGKNLSFARPLRFALAGLTYALPPSAACRHRPSSSCWWWWPSPCFRPEPVWWALVLLASAAVLAAELFNTAIEHLADHLHPELHPLIRVVKDCAAGAVLLTAAGAVGVAVALAIHLIHG